jgi:hypothetical protein
MCKNYTSPKKNQCLILWEKSSRKKALDEEMFQILTLSDVEYTIFNAFKKFFIVFFFFCEFFYLFLPHSWDDRHAPPYPAIG